MIDKLALKDCNNDHFPPVINLASIASIWQKSKKHLFNARSALMDLGFTQADAEAFINEFVWRQFYD